MTTLLALSIAIMAGLLVSRFIKLVHMPNVTAFLIGGLLIGGGFGGTILAFVPEDMLAVYQQEMNGVFGENACVPLDVRPVGAVRIEL